MSLARGAGQDDDLGGTVVAASIVCFAIAAAMVALRFYTRIKIVRVLGAEDWTILAALVLSLGASLCQILMVIFGYGKHMWLQTPSGMVSMAKTSFALVVLYQLSLAFTKVSILILYLRLLTYHYARWAVYIMLGVVVIYNIWGFISEMTICIPLSKLWEDTGYGTCHPISFTWAVIGLHIATDFLIFFLPIPVFFSVTMSLKKKAILLVLFTVGFVACIISILRAVWINMLSTSTDYTYDYAQIAYWNLAEVNISVVCACLMTFKPLVSHFWPRYLGSSDSLQDSDSDGRPKPTGLDAPTRNRRNRSMSTDEIAMVGVT